MQNMFVIADWRNGILDNWLGKGVSRPVTPALIIQPFAQRSSEKRVHRVESFRIIEMRIGESMAGEGYTFRPACYCRVVAKLIQEM